MKYQGKGYAQLLPTNLIDSFERAATDPELLNLTEEIALVQARIHQLLPRLLSGESSQRLKNIQDQWKLLLRAEREGDAVSYQVAWDELKRIIPGAGQDYAVWNDIFTTLDRYQKLTGQEQKRRMDMNALVSADEAVAFLAEIMNTINETIDDEELLDKIKVSVYRRLETNSDMGDAIQRLNGRRGKKQ